MDNCGQCIHYRSTRLNGIICDKTGKSTGYLQEKPCFERKTQQNETIMEENTEKTKVCKKCGRILPVSEFNRHYRTADKLQPYCKECQGNCAKEARKKGVAAKTEIEAICAPEPAMASSSASDASPHRRIDLPAYSTRMARELSFSSSLPQPMGRSSGSWHNGDIPGH